jgi:hypothetical protein
MPDKLYLLIKTIVIESSKWTYIYIGRYHISKIKRGRNLRIGVLFIETKEMAASIRSYPLKF